MRQAADDLDHKVDLPGGEMAGRQGLQNSDELINFVRRRDGVQHGQSFYIKVGGHGGPVSRSGSVYEIFW